MDGQKNTVEYKFTTNDTRYGTQNVYVNDSIGKFVIGDAVRFQLIKQ